MAGLKAHFSIFNALSFFPITNYCFLLLTENRSLPALSLPKGSLTLSLTLHSGKDMLSARFLLES
jgi:hypothetical protein